MAADKKVAYFYCLFFTSVVWCNEQYGRPDSTLVGGQMTQGSPWPHPMNMTQSVKQLFVDKESFMFTLLPSQPPCEIIQEAFVRYQKIIFGSNPTALKFSPWKKLKSMRNRVGQQAGDVSQLMVTLTGKCTAGLYPSLTSDESYTLEVSDDGKAALKAPEVWGVLRGLETFSQLIYETNDGALALNVTSIQDAPRFQHRGLLLDTSRHFLSVRALKENLDVMAQNKLNVFHWHIVDDQSFPYESPAFPQMSMKGAYEPFTHVYTQTDVQEIIEYARLRGIRVIPEFDTPGHTQSWGNGITDLLTKCYSGGKWNGKYGPVDPILNSSYTFLQEFFSEIANVFPDKYVHLGGDEVSFDCWASNPDIITFMADKGFGKNYSKLEEYYMQNLLNIVNNLKKSYIIWQEVIDNGATVASDTVIEVWKGGYQAEMKKVTSLGYKAILSSPWYVNYISYGTDWTKYYTPDPHQFDGTQKQKDLVMGGETCLWGEFVDDSNLISRLWPRASAVAERLWSPANINDTALATPRIMEHRCRLVGRGFPAEPVTGPGFCRYEYMSRG